MPDEGLPGMDMARPGDSGGPDMGPPPGPKVTMCPGANLAPLPQGVCKVEAGSDDKLITGTILTPGEVLRGGQVLVDAKGMITCVACDCSAAAPAMATKIICPRGVISPGLINTHDHITYTNDSPGVDGGERYEQRS